MIIRAWTTFALEKWISIKTSQTSTYGKMVHNFAFGSHSANSLARVFAQTPERDHLTNLHIFCLVMMTLLKWLYILDTRELRRTIRIGCAGQWSAFRWCTNVMRHAGTQDLSNCKLTALLKCKLFCNYSAAPFGPFHSCSQRWNG